MNIKKEFLVITTIKCFFILIISIKAASAAFMVEPSINYYSADFEVSDRSGSFTGKVAGLNLGYMNENFMVGITLEKGSYEFDSDLTTEGYENFDGGGIGTFISFIFWDRIRVWTGYLNSTLEPTDNSDFRYFGQHFSYGIGSRIVDGLLFNYKMFSNQFTQEENDTTGKTTGLDSNIKTNGSSFSLSYILVF